MRSVVVIWMAWREGGRGNLSTQKPQSTLNTWHFKTCAFAKVYAHPIDGAQESASIFLWKGIISLMQADSSVLSSFLSSKILQGPHGQCKQNVFNRFIYCKYISAPYPVLDYLHSSVLLINKTIIKLSWQFFLTVQSNWFCGTWAWKSRDDIHSRRWRQTSHLSGP